MTDRTIHGIDNYAFDRHHARKGDKQLFELSYDAEVASITALTENVNLYRIRLRDEEARSHFSFLPGQFIMLEVPGIGEAPFTIASSPAYRGELELCIRNVGTLTSFLTRIHRGLQVGISGPFGTSFPLASMQGADLIFVAGGLGIVALRSPLLAILGNRSRYGGVEVIYGAASPSARLFSNEFGIWQSCDIGVHSIVDTPDAAWSGPVGNVASILKEYIPVTRLQKNNSFAIVCGPPVMFIAVCDMLIAADLPPHHIFVSLERRMHCGRGKCCRCNIGSTYTCTDGPVFNYWSILNLKEAI